MWHPVSVSTQVNDRVGNFKWFQRQVERACLKPSSTITSALWYVLHGVPAVTAVSLFVKAHLQFTIDTQKCLLSSADQLVISPFSKPLFSSVYLHTSKNRVRRITIGYFYRFTPDSSKVTEPTKHRRYSTKVLESISNFKTTTKQKSFNFHIATRWMFFFIVQFPLHSDGKFPHRFIVFFSSLCFPFHR